MSVKTSNAFGDISIDNKGVYLLDIITDTNNKYTFKFCFHIFTFFNKNLHYLKDKGSKLSALIRFLIFVC